MLVAWYAPGFTDDARSRSPTCATTAAPSTSWRRCWSPGRRLDPYASRHLLGALVGLAGLALDLGASPGVLGGSGAGLLALLLLATLPGWWGHMFFNSKDVPFAVAMLGRWRRGCGARRVAQAAPAERALARSHGRPDAGHQGRRHHRRPVPGVPHYVAGPGRRAAARLERRRRSDRWCGPAPVAVLPALRIVLIPVWPWVALAPGNFFEAIGYLDRFPYSADTIFAGQRYPAPAVPLAYWPDVCWRSSCPRCCSPASCWPALSRVERMLRLLGQAAIAAPLGLVTDDVRVSVAAPLCDAGASHRLQCPYAISSSCCRHWRSWRAWDLIGRWPWSLPAGGSAPAAGRRRAGAAAGPHRAAPPLRVCLLQRRLRRRRGGCRAVRARLLGHLVRRARPDPRGGPGPSAGWAGAAAHPCAHLRPVRGRPGGAAAEPVAGSS